MSDSIFRRKRQLTLALTERNSKDLSPLPLFTYRRSGVNPVDSENDPRVLPSPRAPIKKLVKMRTEESRTNISNYIQVMKSKVISSNQHPKLSNNQEYWKLNIKKRYREMYQSDSTCNKKPPKLPIRLSDGIRRVIDNIVGTYEFVKDARISFERLSRLVKISTNQNKLLGHIFLNPIQPHMKSTETDRYEVVLNKKVILSRLQKVYPLFKLSPEEIENLLNLFFEKIDTLVHEMDTNAIKDVQKSLLRYNALIQGMNNQMPIAINKEKYKSQKNILFQIKLNEKNLGECKNISRMSRQRYELLDGVMNGINSHPLW